MQSSLNLKHYEQTRGKHFLIQENVLICTSTRWCHEKISPMSFHYVSSIARMRWSLAFSLHMQTYLSVLFFSSLASLHDCAAHPVLQTKFEQAEKLPNSAVHYCPLAQDAVTLHVNWTHLWCPGSTGGVSVLYLPRARERRMSAAPHEVHLLCDSGFGWIQSPQTSASLGHHGTQRHSPPNPPAAAECGKLLQLEFQIWAQLNEQQYSRRSPMPSCSWMLGFPADVSLGLSALERHCWVSGYKGQYLPLHWIQSVSCYLLTYCRLPHCLQKHRWKFLTACAIGQPIPAALCSIPAFIQESQESCSNAVILNKVT